MRITEENGFTLVELIVITCMMSILFITLVSCGAPNLHKAREAEVKANLRTIQVALERYEMDHIKYPTMLWGGDKEGWQPYKQTGCRAMWDNEAFNGENEDTARPPLDPLIKYGYLSSYPTNPFSNVSNCHPLDTVIRWSGLEPSKYGNGDPRFGFSGAIMGNIIEDPRYLWKAPGVLTRIKNFLPEDSETNNTCMINAEGKINPFYSMGGLNDALENHWTSDENFTQTSRKLDYAPFGKTISVFWPGQFYYRSRGKYFFPEEYLNTSMPDPEWITIWQFRYSKIDRYVIGAFGAWTTEGMDVIRLTDIDGKPVNNWGGCTGGGYFNPHPDYSRTSSSPVHFSSPEVMGGGSAGTMPYIPYLEPGTGSSMYGAPDGYKDGVIIILTAHY